jgi:hypothetical protein
MRPLQTTALSRTQPESDPVRQNANRTPGSGGGDERRRKRSAAENVMVNILRQELGGRNVVMDDAPAALEAAGALLAVDRASWPAPCGPWEELVVSVALATRRAQGAFRFEQAALLGLVAAAVEELRAEAGAGAAVPRTRSCFWED